MKVLSCAARLAALCLFTLSPIQAQTPTAHPVQQAAATVSHNERVREALKKQLNENVVSIVSGNPNGGYLGIAYDIAAVVDNEDEMRVLPIVGKGAVQNLKDVLFLRGVDMGLANTVTLSHFKKTGELGTNLEEQVTYITMLFQDELHVLVRPEINSLYDLEGKKVNFSDKGSGAQLSSQGIFATLRIKVTEANMGQGDAIEAMKKGELAATMCTCLKPLKPHQAIAADLGFKLLNVAYDPSFFQDYIPARLTSDDYPNLIPKDAVVTTISVPTLLIAYNWPRNHDRYRRLEKFVDQFFSKFDQFGKAPRHPRWTSVNIAANLAGWRRFPAAQEWLEARATPAVKQVGTPPRQLGSDKKMKDAFEAFVNNYAAATGTKVIPADKRDALFTQFIAWWETQRDTVPSTAQ
jgi:uncharacterized protein